MSNDLFSLNGKVALVTGSSTGLGKVMARALGRAGAKVAQNYFHNEERAAQAFAEFQETGAEGAMFRADVTDEADVNRLVAEATEQLGPIDIVVLNATPDQPQKPIEEYDWAFYQSMLDFFIKSPFLVTRAVLPHMKAQKWGRIINITSVVGSIGNAGQSNYAATKAGAEGMARSLARELGSRSITVNCVAPGFIDTDMTRALKTAQREGLQTQIPLGRLGEPEDVAAAVAFLASDAGQYITGETIHVNGGLYMG